MNQRQIIILIATLPLVIVLRCVYPLQRAVGYEDKDAEMLLSTFDTVVRETFDKVVRVTFPTPKEVMLTLSILLCSTIHRFVLLLRLHSRIIFLKPYKYGLLDIKKHEIRLLRLLPGNFNDNLECEFFHVSLDEAPGFEALSYTWGLAEFSYTLIPNKQKLSITQSVDIALRYMRLTTIARTFWIDAVCINQKDIHERNQQIQLMRSIYSIAEKVVVWLGEDANLSETGMKFVEKAVSRTDFNTLLEKHSIENWRAVSYLMNRPWWTRAWVVQEVGVAKEAIVCCGSSQVPFQHFRELSKLAQANRGEFDLHATYLRIMEKDPMFKELMTNIHMSSLIPTMDNIETPLLSVLFLSWKKQATDDRDKVYAMLGLATGHNITPGYTKSLATVYTDMAEDAIMSQKCFDVLSYAAGPERKDGIPSWVPDWRAYSHHTSPIPFLTLHTAPEQKTSLDSHFILETKYWRYALRLKRTSSKTYDHTTSNITNLDFNINASALLPPILSPEVENGVLKISGHLFEEIVDTSKTTTKELPGEEHTAALQDVRNFFDAKFPDHIEDATQYVGGGTLAEAMLQTSEAGRFVGQDQAELADNKKPWGPENISLRWILPYSDRFGEMLAKRNRRVFVTKSGYLGLGPNSCAPGDLVALFSGCKWPFVVREEKANGESIGYWLLVGEAYGELSQLFASIL
ncbi:uncharacterized protein PAC_07701 [Phialocephala subalpina]|uniref:Heterokaryon incompatibility domain-containing protein n=1 Tax=Phialocephala subalpina TaxID=576137 RepID=A0A1L7WYH2_9HELO|nr:uncharacterized protein PAC_07701 [Phialocephala subalpina]